MKRFYSIIRKINDGVANLELAILIVITVAMIVAAFLQVLLRNFFNAGIDGMDIILRHLVLWIGFIGASLATRDHKHISIDVLSRVSPPWLKRFMSILCGLFTAIVSFMLSHAAWQFVLSEREYATVLFGTFPAWYFELVIPIGFLVIGIRFMGQAVAGIIFREETGT